MIEWIWNKKNYSSTTIWETNLESNASSSSSKKASNSLIACKSLSHEKSLISWRLSISSKLSKMMYVLSDGIEIDSGFFALMYIEHDMICLASQPFPVNSLPQGQEYLWTIFAVAIESSDVTFFFFCASALNVNKAVLIPDAPV